MPKMLVSKRDKNEKHFTQIKESVSRYKSMIIFDMLPVRTKLLHTLRETMRDGSKIVFGKKTIIKKALKDHSKEFLDSLTKNTFIIFTNQQTDSIIKTVIGFNKEKKPKSLTKGILKANNQPVPTVLKKNLQQLPLIEVSGQLHLQSDFVLDDVEHHQLIKLLKLTDDHVSIAPLYLYENGQYAKLN